MERFRRRWYGWTHSSDGYSVRLMGRTRLQYRDSRGELEIFAEPMSKPWSTVIVDIGSIPDNVDRPRAEIVRRLQRALDFAGLTMIETTDNGASRPRT